MVGVESIVQKARRIQSEIDKLGMGIPQSQSLTRTEDFSGLYDILIKSKEIRNATRKLFLDGHYSRAVEEAYKCLNNFVKTKSHLSKDGYELMLEVFSEKNPILKLNELKTQSEKDEQKGYMFIFAGCMTGIRNPRAHEHQMQDSPAAALEMLVWANHLMKAVHKAKRLRKTKRVLV